MVARPDVHTTMGRLLRLTGTPVRSEWTAQESGRLHHLEAGSGPVIVLLHGGTGGGANWFRMMGPLAARFRVLAPDLPGFGLSDPIAPVAQLGDIAARCLLHWIECMDVSDALVVGTSFGGLAALRLAQRSPRVSRLLLLDAAGLGRGIHISVRLAAGAPFTALAVRPTRRGTATLFRRLLTSDCSDIPASHQELLIDYLYASALSAGTPYLTSTLRLFAGAAGQREVLRPDELGALSQRVAIVWGELDRLLPAAQARLAASSIPRASLRVLPRTGHSPNWERPDAVIDSIAELASQPAVLPDRALH